MLSACPAGRCARFRIQPLIDGAVAVVVNPVADLNCSGTNPRLIIVTIPTARRDAVSVDVEAIVDDEVAVLIATVTDLDGAGVDTCITIVAVALGDGYAVVVSVHSASHTEARSWIADLSNIGACHVHTEVFFVTEAIHTALSTRTGHFGAKVHGPIRPPVATPRVSDGAIEVSGDARDHRK